MRLWASGCTWMRRTPGSAMVCPELRWAFEGVDRADSLVVNPHKWMLVPVDCSLLWSRRPNALRAAFSLVPEYLRTPDAVDSLGDYGPALGRRFRSLKLWAVLRCYGREGLQRLIREHVRLAELFEGWVRAEPGWEIAAPRHFSLVCFRRDAPDEENEATRRAHQRDGRAVSLAHEARRALRPAAGNRAGADERGRRAARVGRAATRGRRPVNRSAHNRNSSVTLCRDLLSTLNAGGGAGWPHGSDGVELIERGVVEGDAVTPERTRRLQEPLADRAR